MLGALRYVLALLVVISHLMGTHELAYLGNYAVRAFFIVSGFVITASLNEVYAFDGRRFWANRLLRIFPGYLLVCLLTLLLIRSFPSEAAAFMPRWREAPTVATVLQNLLMFPLAVDGLELRLFEPGWSLAVELSMYLLLWLGLARSENTALLGVGLGVAYHCMMISLNEPFEVRYFAPQSAILSFAIGALIYFLHKRLTRHATPLLAVGLSGGVANLFIGAYLGDGFTELGGFYLNTLFCAMTVAGLADKSWSGFWGACDNALGELAYPVFLMQWIGGFLAHLLFLPVTLRGVSMLAASLPVILVLSAALILLQSWLIEPLRLRVRGKQRHSGPAVPKAA